MRLWVGVGLADCGRIINSSSLMESSMSWRVFRISLLYLLLSHSLEKALGTEIIIFSLSLEIISVFWNHVAKFALEIWNCIWAKTDCQSSILFIIIKKEDIRLFVGRPGA